MSVVNAGVVRGRLELENEFDETLRDFAREMAAAKAESKEMGAALRGLDAEQNVAKLSCKETAAALEAEVRAMSDAELEAHALKLGLGGAGQGQEQLGNQTKQTTVAIKKSEQALMEEIQALQQSGAEVGQVAKKIGELERAQRDAAKAAQFAATQQHQATMKMQQGLEGVRNTVSTFRNLWATQFAVQHIQAFAKEMVTMGSEIQDMSDRMGVGVEQAQELKYAITQTGGSIGDASTAISKMNDNLTEGKKGTVAALTSVNLSIEDLRRMEPGKAFETIAAAIKDIPDPMQQTQIAMELFGKSGVKWLPAIRQGLVDLKTEARELGQVLTKEEVAALDEFGDKYDSTMLRLKVSTAQATLGIVAAFKQSWTTIIADQFAAVRAMSGQKGILNPDTYIFGAAAGILLSGARTQGSAKLAADQKRQAEIIAQHGNPMVNNPNMYRDLPGAAGMDGDNLKKQQAAAEAWSKTVKASVDRVTGKDMQQQLKLFRATWSGLSTEEQNNKKTVQSLLEPYEDIRGKLRVLPPDIEKIRDQFGKRLPADNLMTSSVTGLQQVGMAVKESQVQSVNVTNLLKGLRSDGLLPVTNALVGYADAIDASNIKSRTLIDTTKEVKGAFEEAFEGFGQSLSDSVVRGFESNGFLGAIEGAASTTVDALQRGITAAAQNSLGGMGGALVSMGTGIILNYASAQLMDALDDSDVRQADLQSRQMGTDILGQFGGSQRNMQRSLQRAGVSNRSINILRNMPTSGVNGESDTDNPQIIAEQWETAREALMQYNKELEGMRSVLEGAGKIGTRVFKELDEAIIEQSKPFLAAQSAMIDAMEAAGATSEEINAQQAKFTKENEDRVYKANQTQIDSFNNLGIIAGGAIANIVGRTGDMVGAFREAAPLLDQMIAARDNFGLKDQMSAATTEVLRFYDIVKNNADVFDSVAGVGQVLNGMGDAMVKNVDMVNALGHELEQNALTLEARGVSVTEIYTMLSPQLQDLWETVKDGKLVVDDTTKALLDEAEAQGVVGDSMREVNQQILMVLKEIKAMFEDQLPSAIARTGSQSEETGNAVARTWTDSQRTITEEQKKQLAIQRKENESHLRQMQEDAKKMPVFKVPTDWGKLPPFDPPTIPPVGVPVEFEMPSGRSPWDEEYRSPNAPNAPPPPPVDPARDADRAYGNSAATANPGNTTVILEDAGSALLRFTVENTPGYVRVRGGTSVEAI